MNHTPEDDVYRFGFTHSPLSTTSAVAPAVSLASAPQATFEVTTLDDIVDAGDGVLSLREAIQLANDRPGLDTITFAEELRGGTIVLEPSTLAITDDLVIDGDSLNRGAGGITIDAGSELWGGPYSASGPMLGLRGDPKSFITVTLEDVSLNGSSAISTFYNPGGIAGRSADLNMVRSSIANISYGYFGIAVEGSVSLVESSIDSVDGFTQGTGIRSNTSISLVDSDVSGVRGRGAFVLEAPNIELLRSTVQNSGGTYGTNAIAGDTISIVDSTITGISGGFVVRVISGDDIEVINSTITGNRIGTYREEALGLAGVIEGDRVVVVNSTIAENRSPFPPNSYYGWVGFGISGQDVRVSNSIVMGNGTDGLLDFAPGTRVTSNGFNVFGQAAVDGSQAGDVLGADARLVLATGVLADNGGPTRTLALADRPDNPALDNADPADAPPADQRGFLARDQPLVITDDLVIDGDRLDGGAGGIVVSTRDWSGVGVLRSPVEIRGRTGEISVTFEDLTVRGDNRNYLDGPVVSGERASIDLLRAEVGGYASAISTDGLVTLTDSRIDGVQGIGAGTPVWGIFSRTGISLVDSTVTNVGGSVPSGLSAPAISLLRSTVENISGSYGPLAVGGERISIVESTISGISGYTISGRDIEIINSTIAESSTLSIYYGSGINGERISIATLRSLTTLV